MPSARLVLTSNAVGYNLMTLIQAQVKNFPSAPHELQIQMPDATIEAANTGNVKIGRPDSFTTPTDVTGPEDVLTPGDSIRYAPTPASIDAMGKWLKGSAANQVLYVSGE